MKVKMFMEEFSVYQIFLIISLLLIVFATAVMIIYSVKKGIIISSKNFILLYSIFAFGIVLFTYCFEPASFIRWDLLEHYKELENIRNIGWTYCVHDSQYSNLYVCMIYFYLISLTGNYHLLPAIPVLTEMLIFLYVVLNQFKLRFGDEIPIRKTTMIIYSWLCSYGFLLSISGVRCVWAISISFLGLYLEYFKGNRKVIGILLMLVGILIHPAAVLLPVIRVALLFPYKKIMLAGMILLVMFGSKILLAVVTVIPISFLNYVASLMFKYWDGLMIFRWFTYVSNSSRSIYLCFLCITMYQLYLLMKIKIGIKDDSLAVNLKSNQKIINLGETILLFQITGLFNYLFTERIMYITAYNFILLIPMYVKYARKNELDTIFTLGMVLILAWLFFFDNIYNLLVNYTGVYFLAM